MIMPTQQHGFTLVEMAIVLVIVGLVVGGVLVGRDLIELAEVRAQAGHIGRLNTAVHAFRLKYLCLPGDCRDAVAFGLGVSGGSGDDGDENGIIGITALPDLRGTELQGFWRHLANAGLAETPPTDGWTPGVNSPPLRLGGMGLGAGNPAGGVWLGPFGTTFPGPPVEVSAWVLSATSAGSQVSGIYLPARAHALDTKIDEGYPLTGIMRVAGDLLGIVCLGANCEGLKPVTTSAFADACVDDAVSPAQYNLGSVERTATSLCTPVIRMGY